jgi:hypothetical protein
MTGRATGQLSRRSDLVFRGQLLSDFFLIRGGLPIHVENLVSGAKVLFGVAVAIEAPLHGQRRSLENERHLVDRAMARRAANPLVNVNAVVEVDVIGQAVDPDPLDRLICPVAFANRFEIADVAEENRMAIHAGFRRGNTGECRSFDARVTVTTVDAVIANMVLVAKLHGLLARHALVGDVRRARNKQDDSQGKSAERDRYEQTKPRNKICTTMKNLCHVSGAPEGLPLRMGVNPGRFDHSYAGQRVSGSNNDPTVSNKTKRNATSFPASVRGKRHLFRSNRIVLSKIVNAGEH